MGEQHTGPKHPLNGMDREPYFDLHVVSLNTNQKERATEGTWRSITRLTPSGRGSLALVGCPSRRGTPIIIPWVIETR